jgi:hypothetical protein
MFQILETLQFLSHIADTDKSIGHSADNGEPRTLTVSSRSRVTGALQREWLFSLYPLVLLP